LYISGFVPDPNYGISSPLRAMGVKPGDEVITVVNVVLNWFEELKRLAPTN